MTPLAQFVLVPFLRLHDTIYRKTDGRIGHRIPGMPPSLLLHTIGAKTGQQSTTALTYAKDGDSYVVVASKGGDEQHPGGITTCANSPTARSTSARSASE
jgi:hypothetical protein